MASLPISEIEAFVTSQRSAHTGRAYRQDIDAFIRWMGDDEATEENVIAWRDYIENELSNASALRRFTTLRTFYKFMGGPSPFERVKPPRRISGWSPVVPDERDIDAVLSVCGNTRDRGIIALLNNGLRAQEVCDLKWLDVYWDDNYKRTILRVTGKGNKMRLVPANTQTVIALKSYQAGLDYRNGTMVFPRLNIRKVYHVIKKWSKAAKVQDLHPHSLRHGYATRLARAKVSVFSMQRLLGHERAETTGIYVNLDLSDLVEATAADPRDR